MSLFAISSTLQSAHRVSCWAVCAAATSTALLVGACSGGNDDGRENTHACDSSQNVPPTGVSNCRVVQEGHYYVGFAFPYSGGYSPYVGIMESPPLLAIRDANAAEGIGGKCIGVVACDTGDTGEMAVAAFQELGAVEPLGLIIGPFQSALGPPIAPVLATIEKAAIAALGNLESMGEAQGWFFLAVPGMRKIMGALGSFIFRDVSSTPTTYIRTFTQPDMADSAAKTKERYDSLAAEAGGIQLPLMEISDYDEIADPVVQAKADGVDLVYLVISNPKIVGFLQAAQAASYAPRVIYTTKTISHYRSGIIDTSYLPRMRDIEFVHPPSFEAFAAAFKEAFGSNPSQGQPQLYDATCTGLLAMALATDPTSGPELKGLLHTAFDGTEPVTDCRQGFEAIAGGASAFAYQGPGGLKKYGADNDARGLSMNLITYAADSTPPSARLHGPRHPDLVRLRSRGTSGPHRLRVDVDPNGLRKKSQIMTDKAQTASRAKVGKTVGRIDDQTLLAVNRLLALFLGFA